MHSLLRSPVAPHAQPARRLYPGRVGPLRASLLSLLSLLVLTNCDCDDDLQTLKPDIVVSPLVIDFGAQPLGLEARATFTIQNIGTAGLNITGAESVAMDNPDPAFFDTSGGVFSAVSLPERVPINESANAEVRFVPIGVGGYGGTLVLQSDDSDIPEVRIALLGRGGEPEISADPPSLLFGTVNEGPGARAQVVLSNIGSDTLRISDMALEGGAAGSVFSLESPLSEDIVLLVGEATSVGVRMDPTTAAYEANGLQPLEDALIVTSNATNEPSLRIPLRGDVNRAPAAVAVEKVTRLADIKVGIGREVIIDGSDTQDPEGHAFTYAWTLDDAPGDNALLFQGVPEESCTDDSTCDLANGYRCTVGTSTTRCREVAQTHIVPQLPGTYVIRLRATDEFGAFSEAQARILPRDLAVLLRWSPEPGSVCTQFTEDECDALPVAEQQCPCDQSDLDLHLIGPGPAFDIGGDNPGADAGPAGSDAGSPDSGTGDAGVLPEPEPSPTAGLCDLGTCPAGCTGTMDNGGGLMAFNHCVENSDAHVDTCRRYGTDCSTYNRYPEWGQPGRLDDPRLDVDDVRGAGPEIVTLNNPPDGTYEIAVHYYLDRIDAEPSLATVEVYVKGELQLSVGPQYMQEGDVWYAGQLSRTGGPQDGEWTMNALAPVSLDLGTDVCGY